MPDSYETLSPKPTWLPAWTQPLIIIRCATLQVDMKGMASLFKAIVWNGAWLKSKVGPSISGFGRGGVVAALWGF